MKPSVKQASLHIKKKNSKHNHSKHGQVFHATQDIEQKTKKEGLVKISHSAKRYSKQMIKNMLLSKTFHVVFKVVVGILLTGAVSYGVYSYFNRSLANDIVVSKSEIVERVSKLTPLPEGVPDAIVRVEDPETLKKQNSFYENVKNGDYILIYPKLAVIYDLRNNTIVAIKKSE